MNRMNIKGTRAWGFTEERMMVSPKLVPVTSLHSGYWKVPGSLLPLWERMQLFKSKDLAAAEMCGTRGSCLIGQTDRLRFGVSVNIPGCSWLRVTVWFTTETWYNLELTKLGLGTDFLYKMRIIQSSQISYSSSKWICSTLGNWYIVKTLTKNLTAIPAASIVQGVGCYPVISRCPLPSPLFPMCCHIPVPDELTHHSSVCFEDRENSEEETGK